MLLCVIWAPAANTNVDDQRLTMTSLNAIVIFHFDFFPKSTKRAHLFFFFVSSKLHYENNIKKKTFWCNLAAIIDFCLYPIKKHQDF